MDRRTMQMLSFLVLALTMVGLTYGATLTIEATYEDMSIKYHSLEVHSLGYHKQGEVVRAKVVIDEGSVKVLEGREATIQLLDSANKGSLMAGEGYLPLREVVIDTKRTDIGTLEYTAHASDTYYIVYRNEDWWNLTLLVADGEALTTQMFIKVLWSVLFVTTILVFARSYGRLFDVNVRALLGLVARPRGPGTKAAREPMEPPPPESDIIE